MLSFNRPLSLPWILLVALLAMTFAPQLARAENEGQEDLDQATQMQLEVGNDFRKLGELIKLLESSLEKGLDDENKEFAEQMLSGALFQRGEAVAVAAMRARPHDADSLRKTFQARFIAIRDLQRAAELDPAQVRAHHLLGQLHQLPRGDAKEAIKEFTKVIEAEDADAELKADSYARRAASQTDDKKKLEDLNEAVELDDEKEEFRLMRARTLFAMEKFEKCVDDVQAVIKRGGDRQAAAYELKGNALAKLDKPEEALESLDRATELAPEAISPYVHRSTIYADLGNLDKAIAEADKIIELQPESPAGFLLRSDLYFRDSQPEKALEDVERVLEKSPNFAAGLLTKARILAQMGREKEALDFFEKVADSSRSNAALYAQVGQFAVQLEMPRRAIAALGKGLEIDPNNSLLLLLRGNAHLNISQHAEAVKDFEAVLEQDPENDGALNNLAWVLSTSPDEDVRDGKRAIELATKACEVTDFKEAHILSTLAAAYAETGDFKSAIKWAQKGVDLDDEDDGDQIAQELDSYKRGEPVRESQQLDSGERQASNSPKKDDTPRTDKPAESKPAPGRTIDF